MPLRLLTEQGSDFIFMYAKRNTWPAGGLFSTAGDVAKFSQMLLSGGERGANLHISHGAF